MSDENMWGKVLEARAQRDAIAAEAGRLRESLEEVTGDYRGGADNALEDPYVMERAQSALATPTADAWLAGKIAEAVGPLEDRLKELQNERDAAVYCIELNGHSTDHSKALLEAHDAAIREPLEAQVAALRGVLEEKQGQIEHLFRHSGRKGSDDYDALEISAAWARLRDRIDVPNTAATASRYKARVLMQGGIKALEQLESARTWYLGNQNTRGERPDFPEMVYGDDPVSLLLNHYRAMADAAEREAL